MAAGGGGAVHLTGKMRSCENGRPLDSVFASAPSNSFLGPGSMVSFGGVGGVDGSRNSIYHPFDLQVNGDECSDDYFNHPERKRRLSVDQVRFLERSFEVENKLEPDRKLKLANELSLQPRQIAVWFQNRRARCKTKNLETEYETLHSSYKSLRTDYDSLLRENEKLKAEVLHLKHEEEPSEAMVKEDGAGPVDEPSTPNNEEQSEPWNESVPVQSDLWRHGEEDWSNEELLQRAYAFPKIEDAHCHPHATYCGYGFGVDQDHASSNFRSY